MRISSSVQCPCLLFLIKKNLLLVRWFLFIIAFIANVGLRKYYHKYIHLRWLYFGKEKKSIFWCGNFGDYIAPHFIFVRGFSVSSRSLSILIKLKISFISTQKYLFLLIASFDTNDNVMISANAGHAFFLFLYFIRMYLPWL